MNVENLHKLCGPLRSWLPLGFNRSWVVLLWIVETSFLVLAVKLSIVYRIFSSYCSARNSLVRDLRANK